MQGQRGDGRVIVGAVADGFGENGGVRGYAAQGFVGDAALQLAVNQNRAADKIQPQALVELADSYERIHISAIGLAPQRSGKMGVVFNRPL